MKNILYKEFKLFLSPLNILFLFFVLMLLIPSYPYYVAFFYVTLGIFFAFLSGRENKDLVYMSMLPIPKKDIVTGKYLFVYTVELVTVVLAVPIVILRSTSLNYANQAGIDANIAFLGLNFIMLAFFNSAFLHGYFQKPEKLGMHFIKGCIAITIFYIFAEASTFVAKAVTGNCFWDSTDRTDLFKQIPILVFGFFVYIVMAFASYKRDIKNFKKINIG